MSTSYGLPPAGYVQFGQFGEDYQEKLKAWK